MNLAYSETGDCNVLVASDSQSEGPSNCTLEDGRVIPHDGTLKSGCQVCGCKNGRARCTKHRHCKVSTFLRDSMHANYARSCQP